jgi:hypothetical protein
LNTYSNVTVEKESEEESNLRVSDVSGKTILQNKVSGTVNCIDLNSLENGVYLLELSNGISLEKFKLIIAK